MSTDFRLLTRFRLCLFAEDSGVKPVDYSSLNCFFAVDLKGIGYFMKFEEYFNYFCIKFDE